MKKVIIPGLVLEVGIECSNYSRGKVYSRE